MNRFTRIEFKGPTDALEPGDPAPSLNSAAREGLYNLGWKLHLHEPGVHRVTGRAISHVLVETDAMAGREQPILSLVSGVFLSDCRRIMEQLGQTGHARLLQYVLQQVAQFRSLGEDLAMQHKDSEYLGEFGRRIADGGLGDNSHREASARCKGLCAELLPCRQPFSA